MISRDKTILKVHISLGKLPVDERLERAIEIIQRMLKEGVISDKDTVVGMVDRNHEGKTYYPQDFIKLELTEEKE